MGGSAATQVKFWLREANESSCQCLLMSFDSSGQSEWSEAHVANVNKESTMYGLRISREDFADAQICLVIA